MLGKVSKWLKGADCKSVQLCCSLVRIQSLPPFNIKDLGGFSRVFFLHIIPMVFILPAIFLIMAQVLEREKIFAKLCKICFREFFYKLTNLLF